jgi:hypothetical protein
MVSPTNPAKVGKLGLVFLLAQAALYFIRRRMQYCLGAITWFQQESPSLLDIYKKTTA